MRKTFNLTLAALSAFFVLSACTTVAAAAAGAGAEWQDLLLPIWSAIAAGNVPLAMALGLIAAVALSRMYLSTAVPWLNSSQGAAVSLFVGSGATAAAAVLSTPGAHFTPAVAWLALKAGAMAGGIFATVKAIIVDPYLQRWARTAPGWLRPVLRLIVNLFGGTATSAQVIAKAKAAGVSAVVQNPASGIVEVVGAPIREVE